MMKLKLISSNFILGLLIALNGGINLPSQAQPLIPDEILNYSNFLSPQFEPEIPIAPYSTNWRRLDLLYTFDKHNAPIFSLTFDPQGSVLVSVGSDNDPVLRFWGIGSGKQLQSQRGHATAITSVNYSPDGSTLVTTAKGTAINLWNGISRKYESTFLMHANSVLDSLVTPDSTTLVTGGLDGIRLWSLQYQRPLYTLSGVGNPSYALAIHPNGYVLASGNGEGVISFWNLRTAELISQFIPHEEEINGIIFTPDGDRLITSSTENDVKMWDLGTGALIREYTGSQNDLRAIALSPDGKTLAGGGKDGARIWDLETGELLVTISNLNDWVESLAFSPDSTMLAIGLFSSDIQLWQATINQPEPMATTEQEQLIDNE